MTAKRAVFVECKNQGLESMLGGRKQEMKKKVMASGRYLFSQCYCHQPLTFVFLVQQIPKYIHWN